MKPVEPVRIYVIEHFHSIAKSSVIAVVLVATFMAIAPVSAPAFGPPSQSSHKLLPVYGNGQQCNPNDPGDCGNGSPAGPGGNVSFRSPSELAVDGLNNLIVTDFTANQIRQIDSNGRINRLVGTGEMCAWPITTNCGTGGPASQAKLGLPWGIGLDPNSNDLYLAESLMLIPGGSQVRKYDRSSGNIVAAAGCSIPIPGTCVSLDPDDNGGSPPVNPLATQTMLGYFITDVAVDISGDLFVIASGDPNSTTPDPSDPFSMFGSSTVLKIDTSTNIVSHVVNSYKLSGSRPDEWQLQNCTGPASIPGACGDGGDAVDAALGMASSLAFDSAGNLFILDGGSARVRKVTAGNGVVDPTDAITTVLGSGSRCAPFEWCGIPGRGTDIQLQFTTGMFGLGGGSIAIDPTDEKLMIADGTDVIKYDGSGNVDRVFRSGGKDIMFASGLTRERTGQERLLFSNMQGRQIVTLGPHVPDNPGQDSDPGPNKDKAKSGSPSCDRIDYQATVTTSKAIGTKRLLRRGVPLKIKTSASAKVKVDVLVSTGGEAKRLLGSQKRRVIARKTYSVSGTKSLNAKLTGSARGRLSRSLKRSHSKKIRLLVKVNALFKPAQLSKSDYVTLKINKTLRAERGLRSRTKGSSSVNRRKLAPYTTCAKPIKLKLKAAKRLSWKKLLNKRGIPVTVSTDQPAAVKLDLSVWGRSLSALGLAKGSISKSGAKKLGKQTVNASGPINARLKLSSGQLSKLKRAQSKGKKLRKPLTVRFKLEGEATGQGSEKVRDRRSLTLTLKAGSAR